MARAARSAAEEAARTAALIVHPSPPGEGDNLRKAQVVGWGGSATIAERIAALPTRREASSATPSPCGEGSGQRSRAARPALYSLLATHYSLPRRESGARDPRSASLFGLRSSALNSAARFARPVAIVVRRARVSAVCAGEPQVPDGVRASHGPGPRRFTCATTRNSHCASYLTLDPVSRVWIARLATGPPMRGTGR
jgi:hypothetical protein